MNEPSNSGGCFICGADSPTSKRYPVTACHACRDRATNKDGQLVRFSNTGIGGGFVAHLSDDSTDDDVTRSNIAYIDGHEVYANEAYFGGIVIQPIEVLRQLRKQH